MRIMGIDIYGKVAEFNTDFLVSNAAHDEKNFDKINQYVNFLENFSIKQNDDKFFGSSIAIIDNGYLRIFSFMGSNMILSLFSIHNLDNPTDLSDLHNYLVNNYKGANPQDIPNIVEVYRFGKAEIIKSEVLYPGLYLNANVYDILQDFLSKIYGSVRCVKFNKTYIPHNSMFFSTIESDIHVLEENLEMRNFPFCDVIKKLEDSCFLSMEDALKGFIERKTHDGYKWDDIKPIDLITQKKSPAYISRVDNGCIIRLTNSLEKCCSERFFEHSRIYVPDDNSIKPVFAYHLMDGEYVYSDPQWMERHDFDFEIIGSDDIKGTRLWYILKSCTRKKYTDHIFNHSIFEYRIDSFKLCMCLFFKGYENLLKRNLPNIEKYIEFSKSSNILNIVGSINNDFDINADSFGGLIGLPDRFLDIVNEKDAMPAITMIIENANKKWLRSISNDIFDKMLSFCLKIDNKGGMAVLLDRIVFFRSSNNDNYNPGEFLRYLDYIIELEEKDKERIYCKKNLPDYLYYADYEDSFVDKYADYLRIISMPQMFRYSHEFEWNPSYDQISARHDYANDLLDLLSHEDECERFSEAFNTVKPSFEKYEYENNNFAVLSPQSVDSIIIEGKSLHHCVRTYLSAICRGETIIMFIRQVDDIKKPYFTLEIRDGGIRQCHGVCNSNPGRELIDFLNEFCIQKGIVMLNGNCALCV